MCTKEKILKLAKDNTIKKRHHVRGLADALYKYCTPKSINFDKALLDSLLVIRPEWVLPKNEWVKLEILRRAKEGGPKPTRAENHRFSEHYNKIIKESSSKFDKEFKTQIQKLRPEWFDKKRDLYKIEALRLANLAGSKRPHRRTPLGRTITSVVLHPKTEAERQLANNLKILKPDWFVNPIEVKKKNLLELASTGMYRPSQKDSLGQALTSYTCKTSSTYDESFTQQLEQLNPSWFTKRNKTRVMGIETKNIIINLANSGSKKPQGKLRKDIWAFTATNSVRYDEEFTQKLKQLRPEWF